MDVPEKEKPPPEISEYFRELGKKYGALGGLKTAAKLTPAQRTENARKAAKTRKANQTPKERRAIAQKAAKARWDKVKAGQTQPAKHAAKKAAKQKEE